MTPDAPRAWLAVPEGYAGLPDPERLALAEQLAADLGELLSETSGDG